MDDTNHQLPERGNPSIRPCRNQKAENPVYKIRPNTRCFIQKRLLTSIFMRLDKAEAEYVMRKVHEGICGNHLGAHSLVHKLV